MDQTPASADRARYSDAMTRTGMALLAAVAFVTTVHADDARNAAAPVHGTIRLSSDQDVEDIGRVEDVRGRDGFLGTRVVIGPLLEDGVCRQTYYVFANAAVPSRRDVVWIMQEREPITELAVPRNGACEEAAFFTPSNVTASDGVAILQELQRKYDGLDWKPDGAGEAMYLRCLKEGFPRGLDNLGRVLGPFGDPRRYFMSSLEQCKEGHYSASVHFMIDQHRRLSIRMIAADDRLTTELMD